MSRPDVLEGVTTDDLATLGDGLHHLWCKRCHPEWAARPLGAELGVPFTAWCGVRAVLLARHQTDELPPGACPKCADPEATCSVCGDR